MHRDHEPRRGRRWRASVLDCGSPLPLLRPRTRSESARGLGKQNCSSRRALAGKQSKTWRCGVRSMESVPSFLRRHWDHEPTPNPSQEGKFRAADECVLPSWEGSGVGRFMESLLSLWRLHWDHEPERAQSRAGVPPARAGWKPALPDRRDACPTLRFMERKRIVLCLCAVLVK